MGLAKIETGPRTFFKPENYRSAEALLLEIDKVERGVQSQWGERDQATVRLTVFAPGDAERGQPTEVVENCIIDKRFMVAPLAGLVGQATAVVVAQSNPSPGKRPAWIWDQPDAKVMALVEKWLDERDSEALADEPDY